MPRRLFKNISIFCSAYKRVVLISKLTGNEKRTEIICQNLFCGRIVENVVEFIILFVFFPTMTLKYICQLSETLFLSVFDFLSLSDPHFQEIRCFFVFVRTVGSSLY